jgi:hypothetical protein
MPGNLQIENYFFQPPSIVVSLTTNPNFLSLSSQNFLYCYLSIKTIRLPNSFFHCGHFDYKFVCISHEFITRIFGHEIREYGRSDVTLTTWHPSISRSWH